MSLSPSAMYSVTSALNYKMASTRDVAARCLTGIRNIRAHELLQQAIAKEEAPWANVRIEATLGSNLNESDSENLALLKGKKAPCSNYGDLIPEATAERAGELCIPCADKKGKVQCAICGIPLLNAIAEKQQGLCSKCARIRHISSYFEFHTYLHRKEYKQSIAQSSLILFIFIRYSLPTLKPIRVCPGVWGRGHPSDHRPLY